MLMPEPLHVCLISMEYPPETSRGGVATYTHILARALARIGQRVTVIAQGLSRSSVEVQDGVTVHRIKENCHPLAEQIGRSLGASELFGFLTYARRVWTEVQEVDGRSPIDVIEVPEWAMEAAFLHSRLARIPRIVRLHTPQFLLDELNRVESTWNRRMIQSVERWHLLRSSAVTSISRSLADVVCRKYRLPSNSVTVIPNPLDSALFPPNSPGSPREKGLVFYSGRLEMRKGVHVLMDAFPGVVSHCPGARLVIAGSDTSTAPGGGSVRRWLETSPSLLNVADRVEFLGPLLRSEVIEWCRRAEICVVPSLYEAFGYTCIEAMAAGAAVIASRAGGIPEIIADGATGLLFETGNHRDLCDQIVSLLLESDRADRIRRQGRAHALREYADRAIARRMVQFYRRVVATRRSNLWGPKCPPPSRNPIIGRLPVQ
jgi:glycogen synthase